MALETEAGPADRERKQHGHDAAREHAQPRRKVEDEKQLRGRVGPDAVKGRVAKRHLSRVASEDVPRHARLRDHEHEDGVVQLAGVRHQ